MSGIHILIILFDLPPGTYPPKAPPVDLELPIVPKKWLTLTRHLGRRKTVADSPIWSEPKEMWLCSALEAPTQPQPALLWCEVKKLGSKAQLCGVKNGICRKTNKATADIKARIKWNGKNEKQFKELCVLLSSLKV
jgi:hypothetical protein